MKHLPRLFLFLTSMFIAASAHAAPQMAVKVDGNLNDAAWKHGRVLDNFTFFSGKESGKAPQAATTGKILTDSRYLYLAFECEEPQMNKLQTSPLPRDGSVWTNDSIEIFISPFADESTFYHFLVDTNGQVYDAISIDGKEDSAYNLSVIAGVQKYENSWTVEMAIPLSNLGLSNARDALMNFGRERKPVLENTAWHGAFHQPKTWQRVPLNLASVRNVDVRHWDFGSMQYGNNSAEITLTASQASSAKVLLQVQERGKWILKSGRNFTFSAGKTARLSLPYELFPNRQTQAIRWTVESGDTTLFDIVYRVNLPEDALIASLKTSYYYASENYGKLQLQNFISPSSLKTAEVRLTLKDPGGKVRQYEKLHPLRPTMTAGLDISGWTQGEGAVYVELVDNGKVMGSQRVIIPKQAGPFETISN